MNRAEIYKYAYFFIVAIYAVVFSQFGFENWDSGFVTAFSWRILNGELPYEDFIYIRPPLSAYFHALYLYLLPETPQYYSIRIVSYLLFAAQTYFAVAGIDRLYNLKNIRIQKWGLMIVCFMVSHHNFFPGPWFTTDGIFFATAAFYMVAGIKKQGYGSIILAALLCMASAMTKQSFYFIPLIFAAWMAIGYGLKRAFVFVVSLLLVLIASIIWLLGFTTLDAVLNDIAGTGNSSDLFQVGFMIYLKAYHNKYILAAILILPLLLALRLKTERPLAKQYLFNLSWTLFASALIYAFADFKQSTVILLNAVAVSMLYICGTSLSAWKRYFPLLVLMTIAWCGGLSLGYPYPVLFATGLILSGVVLMYRKEWMSSTFYSPAIIAAAVSFLALLLNYLPYREQHIDTLSYSLEAVSPKLKYIKAGKETVEKNLELKQFARLLGGNYAVLPSSPLTYYIFDHRNPLPADWVTNFEIKGRTEEMLQLINRKETTILIERSFLEGEMLLENPTRKEQQDFSEVALHIFENYEPAFIGKYFIVYSPWQPTAQ